jgi:hypothetical protein
MGLAIAGMSVQEARESANALEAEAVLEVCTPKEWAGIPALPLAFEGAPVIEAAPAVDPAASSEELSEQERAEPGSPETSSDSSSPGSPQEDLAEVKPCEADSQAQDLAMRAAVDAHEWQATRFKGELYIHFTAAGSSIPRCKLRKGAARARPLSRINACGDHASQISSFGDLSSTRFCRDCLCCMRLSESDLREMLCTEKNQCQLSRFSTMLAFVLSSMLAIGLREWHRLLGWSAVSNSNQLLAPCQHGRPSGATIFRPPH